MGLPTELLIAPRKRHSNKATMSAPGWRPWTAYEVKLLARMKAAEADKATLMRTFPGRTWLAIKCKRTAAGPPVKTGPRERKVYPKANLVARVLTNRRRELGMRREELAAKIGVSVTSVEHWEHGVAYAHWTHLEKWAEILGMVIVARPL